MVVAQRSFPRPARPNRELHHLPLLPAAVQAGAGQKALSFRLGRRRAPAV